MTNFYDLGDGIDTRHGYELLSQCETCAAVVLESEQEKHSEWHRKLDSRTPIMGAFGL